MKCLFKTIVMNKTFKDFFFLNLGLPVLKYMPVFWAYGKLIMLNARRELNTYKKQYIINSLLALSKLIN